VIVVTAAGGRTGTAVVGALRARGEAVGAVVARRAPRRELAGLGAEVVRAEPAAPPGRPLRTSAQHLAELPGQPA
jgi:NADPH:quinone reductase-like Zn-dependent oxidoreductase